jgi:tyrosine-protein phosphatase YwqE
VQLFAEGLVHDVASDCHGERARPPGLQEGFERLETELPGIAGQADWFTVEAPGAILADRDLPPRPPPLRAPRRRIGQLLRGR